MRGFMECKLHGGQSLEQQRTSLSAMEQAGPYHLTSFMKGEFKPTNYGSFADFPSGQSIPELVLIEIKLGSSLDKIKAEQSVKGKTFVSCSPAYVGGSESKVAIFR
jgi:hypothetical protein